MENDKSADKFAARAALLDFYADRTASFASLFVASIFGLVTVLAIAQDIGNAYLQLITLACYVLFAAVGLYVWRRFTYYSNLSHQLYQAFIGDKEKSGYAQAGEIEIVVKGEKTDFLSYALAEGGKQDKSFVRSVLRSGAFCWVYLALIVLLAAAVYLPMHLSARAYIGLLLLFAGIGVIAWGFIRK